MSEGGNKKCKSDDCSEWKTLVQNFVTNILSKLSDNISGKVQAWFRNMMKRGLGLSFALIGLIFLMVSISLYLNTVWVNKGPWIGFGLVGLIVCCTGLFMSKK